MPEKAMRTIAKKYGKKPKTVERYWAQAKKSAGIEEKIQNPYAYAMAITQRRLQKTGSKPHKKVSKEQAEKIARASLLEAAPELLSFIKSADYRVIKGVYEETTGLTEDNRWFGAVASEGGPFDYYRVVLRGPNAEKAAKMAALTDSLGPDETIPNTIIQKLLEKILDESGLRCPKCSSRDTLAGTKNLKNHCSSCGHEWGDGEDPDKSKDESFTGTGGIAIAFGAGTPKIKKKRKKKLKESYNDNYLRPNQRERRTNMGMADGTQPAGAIEDDIISEIPKKKKKKAKRRAR